MGITREKILAFWFFLCRIDFYGDAYGAEHDMDQISTEGL